MTQTQKLIAAFDSECKSILAGIRSRLSVVERGEALDDAALEEILRMAHTLKGAARVVDLHDVVTLAHQLETVFSSVRTGKLKLENKSLPEISSSLDAIEDLVAAFKDPTPSPAIPRSVSQISANQNSPPNAPSQKGSPMIETLRLEVEHFDRLLRTSSELLSSTQGNDGVIGTLHELERRISTIEREWEVLHRVASQPLRKLIEIPEFRRIAAYLEFVEQEVFYLSKNLRKVRRTSQQTSWNQRLLGTRLRDEVQKARMVPAESVLEGFQKMVRDLGAEDGGKTISFKPSGMEIEADRVVLQSLRTPLMHILRNCVSHGLETEDERRRLGKDPTGKILLRLETAGGRLRIELEDDGRGLNIPKIAEVARSAGLLSEDEAKEKAPDDLAQLIFLPGFSTAPRVTNISGRGMGLSVVYETVRNLQGTVRVRSELGQRTCFVIEVPLALLNHRLLRVRCGQKTLVIPLYGVDHLRRVKLSDLMTVDGRTCIVLEDKPVRMHSLAALLDGTEHPISPNAGTVAVVVLKTRASLLAVAVDEVLGEQESLIQELGAPLKKNRQLLGAIHNNDGSISIVLDPFELVRANLGPKPLSIGGISSSDPVKRLRILVVDDSITTRTLEKGILEAVGFEVGLAVDGIEALQKLRVQHYDLIISDVEMPHMNGFELLGELKKSAWSAKIPVIMVTSRESDSDRERGQRLGADAYIMKQKFDQEVLLGTIRRIVG